ncbi:MAG TPA: hypothetical protein VNE82_22285, partial [Candidatus Binataceae bacterium]|nr:hypothetical protein [Candidatus Binataceae bacterium]HVB82665.1 hypothetical protein [Candidatus Binataceae bacterium]
MSRAAKARGGVRVGHAPEAGELVRFAAHELAAGLGAMLGETARVDAVDGLDPRSLAVAAEVAARSAATGARPAAAPSGG